MPLRALVVFVWMAAFLSALDEPAESRKETVVVTGVWEPLPLEETDRPVRVLAVEPLRLLSNTFTDLLKLDPSVDLRQRAPNGLQADVSIRGASFGQTLVLIDGLRANDVQSGHHNLNLPTPLEAVGQVEILKGSGSTLYGSDAVGGVVHFITRQPETSEVRLRAGVGNFGVQQQRSSVTLVGDRVTQEFAGSRDFSTGFMDNRDYRNLLVSSTTRVRSGFGWSSILLAHRDSPFGAEQFYGNFNSWERTKAWWATGKQQLGKNTDIGFAFRRHTDLFVLYRDRPQVFTNRHATETWQLSLRRRDAAGRNTTVHYGAEGFGDRIVSNNLGRHDRTRGAAYAAADFRALGRFSLSAGIRDEVYSTADHQISPSLSGGVWLRSALKFRASVSRAFRLPTYTDLYYQDPANRGSADLRPERAWSYDAGLDWNIGGRIRSSFTVFQRREQDGIDYVRTSPADIWRATNFQQLRFTGVEATVLARTAWRQDFELSYTALYGAQDALAGVLSKYVFNYPRHTGIFGWTGSWRGLSGRSRAGITKRLARDPYALWDVYLVRNAHRIRPFLQFSNLSNSNYQEIPGVTMPGRSVFAGLELVFRRN